MCHDGDRFMIGGGTARKPVSKKPLLKEFQPENSIVRTRRVMGNFCDHKVHDPKNGSMDRIGSRRAHRGRARMRYATTLNSKIQVIQTYGFRCVNLYLRATLGPEAAAVRFSPLAAPRWPRDFELFQRNPALFPITAASDS